MLILIASALTACASKDCSELKTVDYVDPDKFSGKWFVIANIPYFAEKDKVGSYTIYRKRRDRVYDDIFVSRSNTMSGEQYQKAMIVFKDRGYDISKFVLSIGRL